MEKQQKYVIVSDGWGMERRIPKDKLPMAEAQYEEFRMLCRKAGDTQENIDKFVLTVKEEE